MRILIADTFPQADALFRLLTDHGHEPVSAQTAAAVLDAASDKTLQLIILGQSLPGLDHLTLCRTLRSQGVELPILLFSRLDSPADKAAGLDSGADDYLTYPWDEVELLARIRALGRRTAPHQELPKELVYGDLRLDLFSRSLTRGNRTVRLGFKEFDVLRLLMTSQEIISKEALLSRVWEDSPEAEANNVEAYISFLRKKLFQLGSKVSIATLRRAGYYLVLNEN